MILTIAKLRENDLVTDSENVIGKVVGFARDHVDIAWDDGSRLKYTDADLIAHGVRVVEGAR